MWTLHEGDCLQILPTLLSDSFDSIVTDPPYGLEFMGVAWDTFRENGKSRPRNEWGDFGSREHPRHPSEVARILRNKNLAFYEFSLAWAKECLRTLKPGGHLLAFGGTRTYHRLACAIEDAGFEIRDQVDWIYGSGFPKSLDMSKAIDKAAGAKREVVGVTRSIDCVERGYTKAYSTRAENSGYGTTKRFGLGLPITAPATPEAKQWDGWGTGLKPAHEPICLARKPLEGTVAANILKWGVGGLDIDGGRIGNELIKSSGEVSNRWREMEGRLDRQDPKPKINVGRWPANVLFDEPAAEMLDQTTEHVKSTKPHPVHSNIDYGDGYGSIQQRNGQVVHYDEGNATGASRFFYVAKAPQSERWFYCLDCQGAFRPSEREDHWHGHVNEKGEKSWKHLESHPTQKPEGLMRYLVRLVTPPGGRVLDPFTGSGSTLVAAEAEGFDSTGIELGAHNCEITRRRLAG